MTEMLETSKDNVYIKISIDDDVNNNSNQVYIDKEFIESIPNAESGETILNAITAFANLQSSLITFTVFGLGDIVIEKDPQDPLKLSLKLLEFGSGLVIDNISLLLELGINGMKGLKILSKENLYTTLITMGIEEIAKVCRLGF